MFSKKFVKLTDREGNKFALTMFAIDRVEADGPDNSLVICTYDGKDTVYPVKGSFDDIVDFIEDCNNPPDPEEAWKL